MFPTTGAVYAALSSGPPRRVEPEGRHDVNLRRGPNAGPAVGIRAMQLAGPYAFGPPPDRASARSDRPGSFRLQLVWPVQFTQVPLAPAASPDNLRSEATMSTTIRP